MAASSDMRAALVLIAVLLSAASNSQVLLEEHFDNVPALWQQGWVKQNRSYPLGTQTWQQGGPLGVAAFDGSSQSFIGNGAHAANPDSASWANISDWLFTPPLALENGDMVSFRALSYDCFSQADRLEVRINDNIDTYVGFTSTTVGNYSDVVMHINQSQLPLGMPSATHGR